jgi:hypothetical protein
MHYVRRANSPALYPPHHSKGLLEVECSADTEAVRSMDRECREQAVASLTYRLGGSACSRRQTRLNAIGDDPGACLIVTGGTQVLLTCLNSLSLTPQLGGNTVTSHKAHN